MVGGFSGIDKGGTAGDAFDTAAGGPAGTVGGAVFTTSEDAAVFGSAEVAFDATTSVGGGSFDAGGAAFATSSEEAFAGGSLAAFAGGSLAAFAGSSLALGAFGFATDSLLEELVDLPEEEDMMTCRLN